jgi:hypothetical protein
MLLKENITWKRVVVVSCVSAGALFLAAYFMLQFRQVGLGSYVGTGGNAEGWRRETLFIDNNLPVISLLTDAIPQRYDYLGLELASFAVLHPIPRVLWPSKPEGLSVSAEAALGLRGLTLSSTFVGEAYMMGGYPAILMVGLLFGWLAGWWNRFGLDLRSNANVVLYASGFFAAVISMRSILWTTTAMLPTFVIWFYMKRQRPKMGPREVQPRGRRPRI